MTIGDKILVAVRLYILGVSTEIGHHPANIKVARAWSSAVFPIWVLPSNFVRGNLLFCVHSPPRQYPLRQHIGDTV